MPETGGTLEDRDAFGYLKDTLNRYGLGSLSQWAWDRIVEGRSQIEILQMLRERAEYKTRFKAIIDRQAKGLPPISEQDVINYESQASEVFHAAGLPAGFYDNPDDFAGLLGNDVSMSELVSRVNDGYSRVANSDPLIRQAFQELYGPSGDAALASIFLDKDRALPALDQQAAAAEFGGASLRFGFPISRSLALGAGMAGVTKTQALSGFESLADQKGLFTQTISEANAAQQGIAGQRGVTAEEGAEAIFGLGDAGESKQQVERTQKERGAAFSGGGGPSVGKSGARGLGSSGMEGN